MVAIPGGFLAASLKNYLSNRGSFWITSIKCYRCGGARRSALRFLKDIHASHSAVAVAGPDAVCLQCLYDVRMVWQFEIQGQLAAARDHGELGHRVLRILVGGVAQSLGQRGVYAGAAQDHAGSDHAGGVRWIFVLVSEGAAGLESRVGFFADCRRCVFYFSQMVVIFLVIASQRVARTRAR